LFIDSHCHLDFSCFDHDRTEVLEKCDTLGVKKIVLPGTQATAWGKQIELAQHFEQLRFALGLHPYFLHHFNPRHLIDLADLLQLHKDHVVALGEIGLDTVIDVDWELQIFVCARQLDIADECGLPVILHHRQSHNELIRMLKIKKFKQGGIVHAFTGSLQQARTYIDLGFTLGIGGSITYPRANKTREAIRQLPLSSLVLETDAPDMPLMGKQGRRNSPEFLPNIFDSLLALRKESHLEVQNACLLNVQNSLLNI
jgi:TatD DNase family protein